MADEKDTKTPPYIPYKTFTSFISSLEESGVPHQIDFSLLPKDVRIKPIWPHGCASLPWTYKR